MLEEEKCLLRGKSQDKNNVIYTYFCANSAGLSSDSTTKESSDFMLWSGSGSEKQKLASYMYVQLFSTEFSIGKLFFLQRKKDDQSMKR